MCSNIETGWVDASVNMTVQLWLEDRNGERDTKRFIRLLCFETSPRCACSSKKNKHCSQIMSTPVFPCSVGVKNCKEYDSCEMRKTNVKINFNYPSALKNVKKKFEWNTQVSLLQRYQLKTGRHKFRLAFHEAAAGYGFDHFLVH